MENPIDRNQPNALGQMLSLRSIVYSGLAFWAVIILLNFIVTWLSEMVGFKAPLTWPISVFDIPLIDSTRIVSLIIAAAVFAVLVLSVRRILTSIPAVIITGILLILVGNMIHGSESGLTRPITGYGAEYFEDAMQIVDPMYFLTAFNTLQPFLHMHSQTHPPGAVLLIYGLYRLLESPWMISVAILILSTALTVPFFHGVLRKMLPEGNTSERFSVFLLLLIPAVQVYFCASVDAIVAAAFLGVLYFFLQKNSVCSFIGTVVFLLIASFLSFAAVFLIPVMIGYDWIRSRNASRSLGVILACAAIWLVVNLTLGYNWLESLSTAARIENPQGFRLLSEPPDYLFSRLECILEIIVFFGPLLLVLFLRGMKLKDYDRLKALTILGIATLPAMFLTGAYKTGETARTCLFIYPFLMLPVAAMFHKTPPNNQEMILISAWISAQILLMQFLGFYLW